MNKDLPAGLLVLSPLFIAFALFLAVIYFRSRYNKAHPATEKTAAQRLRGNFVVWTITGVVVALGAYMTLRATNFASTWTITLSVGLVAFIVGESVGRWSALRRINGDSSSPPSQ